MFTRRVKPREFLDVVTALGRKRPVEVCLDAMLVPPAAVERQQRLRLGVGVLAVFRAEFAADQVRQSVA